MQLFLQLWPVVTGAISSLIFVVIWLVRLEGRVKGHSTRIENIEKQNPELILMAKDIAEIKSDLSWLKKYLPLTPPRNQ